MVALSILATNAACSPGPEYGLKTRDGSFFCFTILNFEFQNYQAKVYDVNGELVATDDNLGVKESTDRYSTGKCELAASFRDVPLGNGPYKIEYLVDGDIVLDT